MNLLLDILHPAHVHFFKGYVYKAREKGHNLTIVTRDKEITNALLDRIGIPYQPLTVPARSMPGMVYELLFRWYKIYALLKRHRIQLAMSISGLSTALPSRLRGIPNITFTDTEDARLSNRLSFPFSDAVATPDFFLYDLGTKHVRYRGLHELAYLRSFPSADVTARCRALGLPNAYVIIRLVAMDALHDIGVKGMSLSELQALIAAAERLGRVYINSQAELPPSLQAYRLPVPIEEIHIALAGALLFIGESPTMAVESSLLGTPAFLISPRWKKLGNMIHLERDFRLLRNFSSYDALIQTVREIRNPEKMKTEWRNRATRFCQSSVDMLEMIEALVEQTLQRKSRERGINR